MDRPTHATIVKGFHKYTRAAKSPEGRSSGNSKDTIKRDDKDFASFQKDPQPEGEFLTLNFIT